MNCKHEYEIGKIYGMKRLKNLVQGVDGKTMAEVECVNCGRQSTVRPCSLFNKKNISCICQNKKVNGESGSRLYGIYHNMLYRCDTETAQGYHNYGGRGIEVCEEWHGECGYLRFYEWAMQVGYADNLTIDRIDVNQGYSPENCCWITKSANTSRANRSKRVQHRHADNGKYYAITPSGEYIEFENANEFGMKNSLNAGMIRKSAKKGSIYHGYKFGYVISEAKCKPQSTIENP